MTTTILVLFNLKPEADPAAYEEWARSVDIPGVRRLPSVKRFDALRMTQLLSGDKDAPYQYAEIIDIDSVDAFLKEVKTDEIQAAAADFRGKYADNPQFIVCETL